MRLLNLKCCSNLVKRLVQELHGYKFTRIESYSVSVAYDIFVDKVKEVRSDIEEDVMWLMFKLYVELATVMLLDKPKYGDILGVYNVSSVLVNTGIVDDYQLIESIAGLDNLLSRISDAIVNDKLVRIPHQWVGEQNKGTLYIAVLESE